MAVLATFVATFDTWRGVTHALQTQCVVQQQPGSLRAPQAEAHAELPAARYAAESDLSPLETDTDSDYEKWLAAQASGTVSNASMAPATPCRLEGLISHEPALTLERPPRA
jgi:hypothetical protein